MTDLVERYRRWLQNIGFDGGPESPPMQALEHIERQAALLREVAAVIPDDIDLYRMIRAVRPRTNAAIAKAIAAYFEPASTTLAKLENADG